VLLAALGLSLRDNPSERRPPLAALPAPAPILGVPTTLLQQLAVADQQWRPRAEPLPGGGTRYVYRRRPGEPALSVNEIKALMADPPTFARERAAIRGLWQQLEALGVRLELSTPQKIAAAGEWDPARRTLRIKPALIDKGSREFARVLNHEAIHVAQSCVGGGLRAQPRLLGLSQQLPAHLGPVLAEPTYAHVSERERELEREAYANQEQLELGLSLLRRHC